MRIHFSVVGLMDSTGAIITDLDAVPREGETVNLPGISQAKTVVRTVVWYPYGEDPSESETPDPTPFAYVIVGSPRP